MNEQNAQCATKHFKCLKTMLQVKPPVVLVFFVYMAVTIPSHLLLMEPQITWVLSLEGYNCLLLSAGLSHFTWQFYTELQTRTVLAFFFAFSNKGKHQC